MASLFDIAADLSQYNDDCGGPAKAKLQVSLMHPQSALGILGETFETIHGARQYRSASRHLPLIRSASMIKLHPTRLAEANSFEALDARLNRLTSLKSSATAPRRVTPTIAVESLIIPPPPVVSSPDNSRKENNVGKDPDTTAKAVLREVTIEIDQLMATNPSSTEEDESLLRMLSDKYTHALLSKLPGTPFVVLVRKKVAQKLQQLEHHICARKHINKPVAAEMESSSSNNNSSAVASDSTISWKTLRKLTPAQHEMLQNLLRLPEKQLLKLPKVQLELVQFAKRYDKLIKATPDQLLHLPIGHQQLVRSMQQQQKHGPRTDKRR